MFLRPHFLITFVVLLAVPTIGGRGRLSAQDDASWKKRFLEEAPPAWAKYRKRAKRFQGSIERITVRLPSREVIDRDRCEIKQRDTCALFLAQSLGSGSPPDNVGLVMAINDRYGFELRRRTPDARWALHQLDVDLSDGMNFSFGDPPSDAVVFWSACPITFILIPSFKGVEMNAPEFTLNRVTPVTHNGAQAVKVELEYRPPSNKLKVPALKGWVLYDPQRSWVIREYNFQTEWAQTGIKASTVVNYEYREAEDGLPIPRRVIRRFTPVEGVDRESRYEFDLKETDLPESDFTLSAFGLPEPGGVKRWSPPWYLLAAVLGIVCLSAAAWLRWRARRETGSAELGSR